jgi:trk system potassium uptake protein
MAGDMYVIIIGCGRFGSILANRLSLAGHYVVVIDTDENAFGKLLPEYSGFRVQGDATEIEVLRQARVESADLLIAATREDNINLMVAQVARVEFGVRRVLARVNEPVKEDVYRILSIPTISPTAVAVDLFFQWMDGSDQT